MVEMGFAWKVRISLWHIVASLKGLEILGMDFLVIGIENANRLVDTSWIMGTSFHYKGTDLHGKTFHFTPFELLSCEVLELKCTTLNRVFTLNFTAIKKYRKSKVLSQQNKN